MRSLYLIEALAATPRVLLECQDASGGAVDSSGNALNFAVTVGSITYRSAGPMRDYSILMPGGASFSRAGPVSTVTNNFTMEVVFMAQAFGGANQTIFYNGNGAANGWGMLCSASGGNFTMCALLGGVAQLGNSGAYSQNAFHHLVIVRDAGTWKYYVDGALDNGSVASTAPNAPSAGTSACGSVSLQAKWSYMAVYETALSAAVIASHARAFRTVLQMQAA